MIRTHSRWMALYLGMMLLAAPALSRAESAPGSDALISDETLMEEASVGSAEPAPDTQAPADDAAAPASEEVPTAPVAQPAPETAPVPAPKPAPAVARTTRRSDRDYSVPIYQQKRPTWALEMSFGAREALGADGALAGADPASMRAFKIQGEYQPAWFQILGVLGLGVSTGLYTTSPSGAVTSNLAGLLSYGAQARYQARFFRNQWIVPTVGYGSEWVRYSLKSGTSGTVRSTDTFFGAMLLLSALDEATAAESYATLGISRAYLVAEARSRDGGDSTLSLGGRSYLFGLRFEF